MKFQSKTFFTLILVIVLDVVCIGAAIYFFLNVQAKNNHISELNNSVETLFATEEKIANARKILAENKQAIDELGNLVVQKSDVVSFLDDLEKLGAISGASFHVNTVDEGTDAKAGNALHLTLSADGSWRNVFLLLKMLEALPYKTHFLSVSLGKSTGGVAADGKTPISKGAWQENIEMTVVESESTVPALTSQPEAGQPPAETP